MVNVLKRAPKRKLVKSELYDEEAKNVWSQHERKKESKKARKKERNRKKIFAYSLQLLLVLFPSSIIFGIPCCSEIPYNCVCATIIIVPPGAFFSGSNIKSTVA